MNWFNKTDDEIIQRLKNTLESESLQFIGKFTSVEDKNFGFFKDVRSISGVRKYYPTNEGEPADFNQRSLEVWSKETILFNSGKKKMILEEGKWYKFYAIPAQSQLRLKNRNPFLLQTDLSRAVDISLFKANELIENIQQDSINTPESVKGKLTRSIEAISNEINTQTATFIFELIQNADDYPNDEKNVNMSFDIRSPYLIVKHNGSQFDVNNAVAICDINEGDKRSEVEKIGFKGIGFKSIFKDCNIAYLKSGEYSFRFDEIKWRNEGRKLFWQITPINTDEKEYQNILLPYANVNLVIKPREPKQLSNYKSTLLEHFKDERILLFLRNVKGIDFILNDDSFSISNTDNKWRIFKSRNILVEESIREELNRGIALNDKRIPLKYQSIEKTEIGFGFLINENKVQSVDDATVYAYLPTKVNLGLGFLLNGNFIPDGSRTHLHQDLNWNEFLFEKAGELFPNKLIELIESGIDKSSVLNLIPSFNVLTNINDDEKIQFIKAFKKGFDENVLKINFIPTNVGSLESLLNVIIDETGLSSFLDEDFFTLTDLNGKLISNQIGNGIEKVKALLKEYNLACNIYSINDLKSDLKNEVFQEWLKIPQNNFKIIQHFYSNKNLKGLLETEEIILTANNELSIASEVYRTVPDTITFVAIEKVNDELLNLLTINNIEIELKVFNPIDFYNENIFSKQNSINQKLSNELELLNFWKFIYDYWNKFEKEDNIKASLKLFKVLCKSLNVESLFAPLISKVYISYEFNPENEIESVISEIELQDAYFISEKYISGQRTASKWFRIFKQAQAITDLQKVIEVLLPSLSTIEDSKHFEIAKQIFKYWKENQNMESQLSEIQLNLIRNNLKIKVVDNNYYASNAVIISDHYNNNTSIHSVLPLIELPNQISSEYGPRTNQITDWKNFFTLLNCIELSERQNVLDEKIDFFVENQDSLVENHFNILISISELFKAKSEKIFEFPDDLSKIKLLTNSEEWSLPSKIHLSSIYKPKLDLQNDDLVKDSVKFLSTKYIPNEIDKYFIESLGVNNTFKIKKTKLKRDQVPLDYLEVFEKKDNYIVRNAISWGYQHRLINHIMINYPNLLVHLKYSIIFWEEVIKHNSKLLNQIFEISNYKMALNKVVFNENYLIYYIKTNKTIPNQCDELKKPEDLFSFTFENYVDNKSELPKYDFSKIYLNNIIDSKSLEDILGIKNHLSEEYCIKILTRIENRISLEKVIELEIIDILKNYKPSEIEKNNLFFLNQNLDWKPINELFFSFEEDFIIEDSQKLHEIFIPIANNFGIEELSINKLDLKISPENPLVNNEIIDFFIKKGKYIAYKIDQFNYLNIDTEIKNSISSFNFFYVNSIIKKFDNINIDYIEKYIFNTNNTDVYYVDNWKFNDKIIDWLLTVIFENKISKKFLQSIIANSENEIIKTLTFEYDNVPNEWGNEDKNDNELHDNDFLIEVKDFIESMKEVEDIYDSNKIEDLKSILAEFKNHPKEKQLTFNLLAKLKLCKKLSLNYDRDWPFNSIESGDIKYLIHSARGSFAYIHPNEILKMRDEEYKMAIDYGTKDIRIYNSYSEIISLYQNYLMLYQGSPSQEDILSICENSISKEKFHFLIADREKQVGEGLAIFKFLNNESYD